MTTYREATAMEINQIAQQLNQYNLWYTARTFIQQFYGDAAASFELEVEGEYNDEGGTAYQLTCINVRDSDRGYVDYDYSKPAWKLALQDEPDLTLDIHSDDFDEDQLNEYIEECYSKPEGADDSWVNYQEIDWHINSSEDVYNEFQMASFPGIPKVYLAVEE